ncbi:MAG TPA: DinB family protein [Vicinamibacterales bacterium]|nr:DinB family protein [Vicinamibacterales bacterium]
MTTTTEQGVSVQRSVTVKAGLEHAFNVFTDGFDTWWPRSHHIGKKPLMKAVIEPRAGGRCFGREPDGNDCQWGTVTTWDPPNRLVIAWQIDPSWQFEPDLSKASEVEVRFTAEAGEMTRVDLEHRHLERHGKDFEKVRVGVGGPGGWGGLLQMFGRTANVYHPSIKPVAFILAGNDSVADRAFIGVKPEDLWKRPTPQNNSMLWIYAHMATVRARMLNVLGDAYDPGLGDTFGRGAQVQDSESYPTREKIIEVSREVNARLFAKLATVGEAELSRKATGPMPPSVQTVGDQLAFFALHDSYHVGQLAYVRKALGLPGVVG